MKRTIAYISVLVLALGTFSNCKKDFLDAKPNKALLVPSSLTDFQAILDNVTVMNTTVGLPNIACDDFYRSDANLVAMSAVVNNTYFWRENIFDDLSSNDWDVPYKTVFYANVVLDGLALVARNEQNSAEFDRIKGSALFFRSMAFFHLSQMFAVPFEASSAANGFGIPLPLNSNVNNLLGRGNLKQTYDQMINDFTVSFPLLPDRSKSTNMPNKCAVYGYLARIYLIMGNIGNAKKYAEEYLKITDKLIDFNTLNSSAARPMPNGGVANANEEVVFALFLNGYAYDSSTTTFVQPELYQLYEDNDLRKVCFFADRGNKNYTFKGSYFASTSSFGGIATDEVYLIKAECEARLGQTTVALDYLHKLLLTRWRKSNAGTSTYIKKTAVNSTEALKIILQERRKELLTRGLRWSDLRRLNTLAGAEQSLVRNNNMSAYILIPNSLRYTFPIPLNETLSSGIQQNPR
ncbi:MAG: RagB/SusD family nutrient uptake outer membrane protein [Chryseobacterium sp.]|nr:MAG: RagB/SusD family nutrient uptake outer membrane protein [Chryseobacterium sp.]